MKYISIVISFNISDITAPTSLTIGKGAVSVNPFMNRMAWCYSYFEYEKGKADEAREIINYILDNVSCGSYLEEHSTNEGKVYSERVDFC